VTLSNKLDGCVDSTTFVCNVVSDGCRVVRESRISTLGVLVVPDDKSDSLGVGCVTTSSLLATELSIVSHPVLVWSRVGFDSTELETTVVDSLPSAFQGSAIGSATGSCLLPNADTIVAPAPAASAAPPMIAVLPNCVTLATGVTNFVCSTTGALSDVDVGIVVTGALSDVDVGIVVTGALSDVGVGIVVTGALSDVGVGIVVTGALSDVGVGIVVTGALSDVGVGIVVTGALSGVGVGVVVVEVVGVGDAGGISSTDSECRLDNHQANNPRSPKGNNHHAQAGGPAFSVAPATTGSVVAVGVATASVVDVTVG